MVTVLSFRKREFLLYSRAVHLKWIVAQILEVIVLRFETTGGLVRGHFLDLASEFRCLDFNP